MRRSLLRLDSNRIIPTINRPVLCEKLGSGASHAHPVLWQADCRLCHSCSLACSYLGRCPVVVGGLSTLRDYCRAGAGVVEGYLRDSDLSQTPFFCPVAVNVAVKREKSAVRCLREHADLNVD